MFSLDRTSCFYSVICSAFSIPMDRTSFFIFYGINILISLECTSFFDFSFGMFLCHWTVPRFIFYYGALSFILIIFFLIVSSMWTPKRLSIEYYQCPNGNTSFFFIFLFIFFLSLLFCYLYIIMHSSFCQLLCFIFWNIQTILSIFVFYCYY